MNKVDIIYSKKNCGNVLYLKNFLFMCGFVVNEIFDDECKDKLICKSDQFSININSNNYSIIEDFISNVSKANNISKKDMYELEILANIYRKNDFAISYYNLNYYFYIEDDVSNSLNNIEKAHNDIIDLLKIEEFKDSPRLWYARFYCARLLELSSQKYHFSIQKMIDKLDGVSRNVSDNDFEASVKFLQGNLAKFDNLLRCDMYKFYKSSLSLLDNNSSYKSTINYEIGNFWNDLGNYPDNAIYYYNVAVDNNEGNYKALYNSARVRPMNNRPQLYDTYSKIEEIIGIPDEPIDYDYLLKARFCKWAITRSKDDREKVLELGDITKSKFFNDFYNSNDMSEKHFQYTSNRIKQLVKKAY